MQTYFNASQGKTIHLKVYYVNCDLLTGQPLADEALTLELNTGLEDDKKIKFPIGRWLAELIIRMLDEKAAEADGADPS